MSSFGNQQRFAASSKAVSVIIVTVTFSLTFRAFDLEPQGPGARPGGSDGEGIETSSESPGWRHIGRGSPGAWQCRLFDAQQRAEQRTPAGSTISCCHYIWLLICSAKSPYTALQCALQGMMKHVVSPSLTGCSNCLRYSQCVCETQGPPT